MTTAVDHMLSILRAGDLPHQRRISIVQMKARAVSGETFKFVPLSDMTIIDEVHAEKK